MSKTIGWYASTYVTRFNMQLVPIEPRRKFPITDNWGGNLLTTAQDAESFYSSNADWNMGLALGPSGFCSLDIDCSESFSLILEEFGMSSSDLDGFPTIQGASKGRRVLFRVPDGAQLPYSKLNWPRRDDQSKRYTVFELRAATDGKQRQDVLPPSIHPATGEPYKWLVQPPKSYAEWPEPPYWLMAMWQAWDKFKPQLVDMCPWTNASPEPINTTKAHAPLGDGASVIEVHCASVSLTSELARYGYKRIGKRWLSPHSTTGLAGVLIFQGERNCWIHHASDPLCSEDSGRPVNAFDLMCHYDYGGDVKAAVKALAERYGLKRERIVKPVQQAPAECATTETPEPQPSEPPALTDTWRPFKALGYSGSSYYYLPRGTEQVAELRRGSHTSASDLMALAPIEWWESTYPKQKGGCDWQMAASDCMRSCEQAGIYSPDRERGRGAWYDKGRSVYHFGDSLLVDGKRTSISDHASRYIYTRQPPMEHGVVATPAGAVASNEVLELVAELSWVKPVHSLLVAGWLALAPVCGSLKWRPHMWLTAPRGAGKTWVQDNIFAPILGPSAMVVQGSTTEAGIRQRLRQDARPIIFDEAEAEGVSGAKRIQTVIELARQSSSDSTAEIVKGTVGGHAMAFRMRSMFMLGSINVSLSQAADESRFSVVQLAKPNRSAQEFDTFTKRVHNTLSDEFCAAIRARSYALIPTIRANAKTLANAVGEAIGSQRIGDQVGTLLAGAWALKSDALITEAEAIAWVDGMDFSDAEEAEAVSDSDMCLQTIMQAQLRVDSSGAMVTRTVGELVALAATPHTDDSANDCLSRSGLRVSDGWLMVSCNHSSLKAILRDTAWGAGWRRVLARVDGAETPAYPYKMAGVSTRVVKIPLSSII